MKKHFYQQWSIEDAQDGIENYEDDHYDNFNDLVFNELLFNIKKIPFDDIIQNHLQYNNAIYKIKETNSLRWLYTADRKSIESIIIYSFRFPNFCHPEFYQEFQTKTHHLFQFVTKCRHKYYGWYKYTGYELLNRIDKYLNIRRIVQNQIPHKTKLYINQNKERIDIQFCFYSINEQITITFEPGYPAT